MQVFAIAKKEHMTYGHGDFGVEYVIPQLDAYIGKPHFAPVFRDRIKAEEYLKTCQDLLGGLIVPLELIV